MPQNAAFDQGLHSLSRIQQLLVLETGSQMALTDFRTSIVRCLFVCVEVLRPSQPNGVMSSAVSLPNLGRLSPLSG